MQILVRIPNALRALTHGHAEARAAAASVADLVDELGRQFPGLRERLVDDGGDLRRFINWYVNEDDIRFLAGKATPLKDGDEVSIVPSVAGGAGPPVEDRR